MNQPTSLRTHDPRSSSHAGHQADLPVITVDAYESDTSFTALPAVPEMPPPSATADLNVIRDAVIRSQHGEPGLAVYVTPDGDVMAAQPGGLDVDRVSSVVDDTFYSIDLNAIQAAVLAAQANDGRVADKDRVYVDETGDVMLGSDVGDPSRASAVVGDTFYTVDLDVIQAAVLAQQANGGRAAENDRVYVDHTGDVMLGSEVGDPSRASSVVGDTFFARDLLAEAETVRTKMPASVKVSDGTYEGYAYSVTNRLDDTYELFIYYHPQYQVYRVALVSPRLGGELDVHGGHLYSDGTLCLTRRNGSGYPSMDETYAKSALWTLGASLFRRGYGFQFNMGQEGDSRA